MSRLSLAFFSTGAVLVLAGMVWGSIMGATHDHTLAPAHAHLNLVGWATLGLMGAFYGVAGDRAPRRMGWINYGLSTAGAVLMPPALARLLLGEQDALPFLLASEVAVIGGALVFLVAVVMTWRRAA